MALTSFILGFGLALGIGIAVWVILGSRLNLYLTSTDSVIDDQAVIPITTGKTRSRRESIEISLTDYQNRTFRFRFGYHPITRFHIRLTSGNQESILGTRKMLPLRAYRLPNKARLRAGDREYTVLITGARIDEGLS